MEQKYVRIIKADSRNNVWYNEHIGNTYPVIEDRFCTLNWCVEGTDHCIGKSDCELVSITVNTMPEEKEPDALKATSCRIEAAEKYADHLENTDFNFTGRHYDYVIDAFKAGAEWLEKAKKGVYPITDSQIKHLFETIGDYSERSIAAQLTLREWFPDAEVFKPKKYVIAVKDSNSKEGYYLHEIGGVIKITQDIEKAHQFKKTMAILDFIKSKHPELICYSQEV